MAKRKHKQDDVNFDVSAFDRGLIERIVDRGWALEWLRRSYVDRLSMFMDVTAVHANGNPLRLLQLLHADDFNFAHDMSGICRKLDRNTGQLMDHFRPRFSARAAR